MSTTYYAYVEKYFRPQVGSGEMGMGDFLSRRIRKQLNEVERSCPITVPIHVAGVSLTLVEKMEFKKFASPQRSKLSEERREDPAIMSIDTVVVNY
jgi:hypothetical protein